MTESQWNQCADDIFQMVVNAFKECRIPEKLNYTLITLVPKVDSPQTMVHFRPISLCSTLYKVISKVLVARLRHILPHIISPNQVSFVPGRQITDNILIAQELMHKFKLSKGKKGFMAWKIDLSKAYDRLNWKFVEHVLVELGLPCPITKLILCCVSTVRYQICMNGELTDQFLPKNGIRQGDPLSPYLFVMCIEKLSHLIEDSVKKGVWKPVKSSQSGPAVSHLFFADDLVLFAEANSTQARVLKSCLERFYNASGQTVNYDKSVVFCSPNTRKETAKEVSLICGSPLTEDLGKYLGMPMLHSRITKLTYGSLIDKVHKRLASWKSKFLSLAGRATLIQAVTSAVPIYAMQTSKLPISVGHELDKLNRNFFWGGREKKLKIHLCQWDLACRPKHKGGLGFKKTTAMNKALLAKVGWRLHQNDKGLWAKIYESKYLKGKSVLDSSLMFRQDCSTTWKGVMYGVELLRQGVGWRVGKGDTTKFWKDSWLIDEPLLKHDGVLHIEDIDCSVSNFFKDDWWDLDKLRRALTEDLVQHVVNYPVGFASNLQDCQIWKGTANGVFSVKTAYNMFFKGPSWPDYSFSLLWKLKIPPKLKIFAWLIAQGKILSNEQRVRRQLTLDASCGVCEWPIETTLHILRDCYKARDIWNTTNLLSQAVWCSNIPWSLVFIFTCWYVWKWRNHQVFQGDDDVSPYPKQLIVRAVHEWFKASRVLSKHNHKVQVDLKWEPPISGQFKLNVDGSRRNGSGHIGAGGVLRNSSGDWISGFAVNLGKGQILEAELWGLFFGLKLAMDKEINNLVVELDSALAVQLIQKQGLSDVHPLAALVASCWELMHKINCCSVYHVYREKNCVADCLATWSYNLDLGFYIFVDAPAWIGPSLIDDLLGFTRSRLVPTDLLV
ncbi:hypothetical protein Prudu_021464 [Prunus dulcis]|uniref:Reverse transcriptase domain-containing protein n=1 Tax=Prunus dulcis TaxID=3755 RepID=A0A4Y1RZ23_PRUDU|nr:hypothetical protein Prudu_021464 [Prunus dulcis]